MTLSRWPELVLGMVVRERCLRRSLLYFLRSASMRSRAWSRRRWWFEVGTEFGEEVAVMGEFLERVSGLRVGTDIVEAVVGVESL